MCAAQIVDGVCALVYVGGLRAAVSVDGLCAVQFVGGVRGVVNGHLREHMFPARLHRQSEYS